jgi:nucleoside permease NupC
MNILFAITGIAFALFVAFLFSFDRKNIDFKKTLIMIFNDIYSSVDCVIYDEHNDWFNNLNCIRLIF